MTHVLLPYIAVALLAASAGHAQAAPPLAFPHVAQYWLAWVSEELAGVAAEAQPPPPETAGMLLLRQDIEELREEVRMLRDSMDEYLGGVVARLQQENTALRQENDRLRTRRGIPTGPLPVEAPRTDASFEPALAPSSPPPPERRPSGPAEYEVVKAWGRTPEEVAALDQPASTLCAMVLVVSPDTPSPEIEELGRRLRRENGQYDNITIDVFTDRLAAEAYVEKPTQKPYGRVLSIAKHGASGLDTILITENGITMDVPF